MEAIIRRFLYALLEWHNHAQCYVFCLVSGVCVFVLHFFFLNSVVFCFVHCTQSTLLPNFMHTFNILFSNAWRMNQQVFYYEHCLKLISRMSQLVRNPSMESVNDIYISMLNCMHAYMATIKFKCGNIIP